MVALYSYFLCFFYVLLILAFGCFCLLLLLLAFAMLVFFLFFLTDPCKGRISPCPLLRSHLQVRHQPLHFLAAVWSPLDAPRDVQQPTTVAGGRRSLVLDAHRRPQQPAILGRSPLPPRLLWTLTCLRGWGVGDDSP